MNGTLTMAQCEELATDVGRLIGGIRRRLRDVPERDRDDVAGDALTRLCESRVTRPDAPLGYLVHDSARNARRSYFASRSRERDALGIALELTPGLFAAR